MKPDLTKFLKQVFLCFCGTVLLVAAATLLWRGGGTPPPADAPVATPSPTPVVAPTPTPVPAAMIRLGNEDVAVVADADAAERVLEGALARHIEAVTKEIAALDATAEFVTTVEIGAAAPDALPGSEEAALATLLARADLSVRVTFATEELGEIKAKTATEKDADLPAGTRIVRSVARAGIEAVRTVHVYEGGAEVSTEPQEPMVVRPAVDGLVIEGRLAAARATATPGRSEGRKGRKHTVITAFLPPVAGKITLNFGGYKGGYHYGVDYACEPGETVAAAAAGTVIAAFERGGYGLFVEIDHGEGFTTRYAGLGAIAVAPGDAVEAGGALGTAGEADLHFELRIDGRACNPRYYLD